METLFKKNKFASNYLLKGEGFFISYNPNTGDGHAGLTDLVNVLGGNVKDGEETALYHEAGEIWYILEGDFRSEYTKAFFEGYAACKKVYQDNISSRSDWSTDEEPGL